MADIRLMRPGAGEVQNITCAPEARFIFDFPTDEATLSRSGDNLVITFEDGATLQLENFYTAYSSKNMPSFEVEGAEISGEDFFTAMNEPDLMPAAGPGGNAGAQSNGNRFHSYVNSELLGGLDRLGGLDIGWNDGGQDSELDGGGGGHVDFGVTLTGESGEVPDPSIPVIDDPTYPDQPGWDQTVTGRDVLNVKESELDGAGSRSVDHGSLLVDARDGVASIVIDGVMVYEGTEPPVLHADARVNTDEGYLTNFRYSAATGRLEYDYVLTQATTEHKGEGKDSIAHNFHVTVTDTDGDTGTGLITVVIEDDVPLAADDAAGLEENEIVSGNVVTGEVDTSGTVEGFVSVGTDDYGADAAAPTDGLVWNLDSWGEKASYDAATETWTVTTDYGTATLHADGSFTFDALKNAGLDEGVSASMNFDYTITDADGDSSSATLTVTVTGDTQPVVTFDKPGADSNAITVDEALLPGGNAGHSDSDAHEPEGEGSFTVNFKGESGDVTLTYGKDESAQTVTLRLEQSQQTVAPSEGGNTLIVNGVTVTVTGAEQQSDGSWTVNYTYNLAAGQNHGNDERIGDDDVLSGTIDITVKDDTDDTATGSLQVTVHDDGPMVTLVPTEYEDKNYFNTVSVSFGADNETGGDSSLAVYAEDAAGNVIEWTKVEDGTTGGSGSISRGSDLSRLPQGESWTNGNIIVSRENGNFVFKIKENGTNADIKVTATDADGDTDSKPLHLTAPDSGSSTIIVDEALLSDGSGSVEQGGHGDGHAASGDTCTGSFTVDLHGEDGTVTLTYGTGENAPTVTVSLINGVTFSNDWLSNNKTLTVNGVTVEVTGATQQQPNGPWQIEYTYELKGEQAHPLGASDNDGGKIGADDPVSDTIDITVTDATGDTATGELTVTVHDDGPVLNVLTESSSSDALNENTGPFVVNLNGFHTGADMVNGTTPAKVTVAVGGQTYTFTVSKITVTDGYYYEFTPEAGQDAAVSIEHGENGYELYYTRPEADKDDTTVKNYTFTVTVTDADGDSVSENITLTTKDRPDISFGDDLGSGRVQEAGVEGCATPVDSTTPTNPNADVRGELAAGGTIKLTDTDSDELTLTVTGSVKHTPGESSEEESVPDAVSKATLSVAASSGGMLTLYLDADGKLVTETELVENEDYYGTLTLDFSEGKEGEWKFDLADNALVNSLNEGESFDITLKLKANDKQSDGTQDDPGYTSTEAALTIHIQGTNDMPVFTTATANGKPLSITEDKGFSSVGDIEVTDGKNDGGESSGVDVSSKIEGKLYAKDPDDDNGGGDPDASENGLTFTVTGFNADASAAGTVSMGTDGKISYQPYDTSSADWLNLVSNSGIVKGPETDDNGRYTSVTTQYGTLKVYTDGSYTYTPTDTSKIGGDEYVTETFTVKVQDAHGSFSEQTITITLRDEDNGITGGAEISQSLREEGVVGDDESLGYNPGDDPNEHVPTQNGTAAPNNVLFTDADVNDTVTLTFKGATIQLPNQGQAIAIGGIGTETGENSISLGAAGSRVMLYLVATETNNGTWSFSWSTDNNGDVVGKLTLSRGKNGDVTYSFALDPNNKLSNTATDNSGFLDQLDQGDVVNIDLDLSAQGADSSVTAERGLTLTITGTNDRPLIDSVVKVENDGTETTETELDTDDQGRSDVELDKTEIYDASSSDTSGDDSSSGETSDHAPDFTGRVVAHDVDSDNGAGSTEASGSEDNDLSFTLMDGTLTEVNGNKSPIDFSEAGKAVTTENQYLEGYTTIETTYGTLTIDQDTGEFTYTMDDPALEGGKPNAIMALGDGQSVTETYTVRVTDAHGSYSTTKITLTITGTNDRPILTSDALEVHAAENNTPDTNYHTDDLSTDWAHASDPDKEDSVTFCFAENNNADAEGQFQSVDITAEQLLEAINKNAEDESDGAVFTSNGKNGDPDTLALLKAWLSANPTEVVATLNITADGELSLTLNQYSDFIEALNGEDSFTFDLSDISNLQVYAKDKGGLLSAESNDVKLVIHGTNDAYVVTSSGSPQVKESGVYKGNDADGHLSGDLPTEGHPGTAYGQEQDSASGSFALAGRDAGQVVFTVAGKSYEETSTTLTKGDSVKKVEFTTDTSSGDTAPSFMYVAGEYGYYKIDLDSNMDADGTRTFTYEYHLYTDSTPEEVRELCINAEGENDFTDRLNAVNALPQGANVSDSVTIGVAVGEDTTDGVTLSAQVSGTNDKPVINGVEKVTADTGKVALEESETLTALHDSKDSGMFFQQSSGEDGTDGPVLHIQVAEKDGYDFVGRIDGTENDSSIIAGGTEYSDGTTIVNYVFVLDEVSSQVWTISKSDDGSTTATSDYGYITIDADGTFTLHIDADAVKDLGQDLPFNLFDGLKVQCVDDLGATSQEVDLHGTLLGRDDAATTTVVNPGMWENAQSAHDESRAPENPFSESSTGAGLVEDDNKTQLKGSIRIDDPDSTDRIAREVTVKVGDNTYTVAFDENGQVVSVDGEKSTTVQGAHGTFTFTFQYNEGKTNSATLHYTYVVNEDDETVRTEINELNDGETYSVKYGSEKNPLPLENIKVSFTSQHKTGEDNDGTPVYAEQGTSSDAHLTIDVHGSNDAPVITQVQVGTAVFDEGAADDSLNPSENTEDSNGLSGGTVSYHGSATGTITASDVDNLPAPVGNTDQKGGVQYLRFGFLLYTDDDGKTSVLYAQTGRDGITQYCNASGEKVDVDLASDKLTFSNHATLEHGTIHINDYGEYTYTRNPNDSNKATDSVYITVQDENGAMDSVKIDFDLADATGPGHLPDVSIEGVTMPGVTEPGENGELVVAGEESGVVSSFDQGGVEGITLTVQCYYDEKQNKYIPVYEEGDSYYIAETGRPVPEGTKTTTLTGTLVKGDDGDYEWVYKDKNGEFVDSFEPSLDFRLSEAEHPSDTETVYSLSTDYGTVYVDKETGELRFELDSRADALNAGEVKEETVYLWVNGETEEITLTITGTGDPSQVQADNITVDMSGEGEITGDITITDIDNSDGTDGKVYDTHTLTLIVMDENGQTTPVNVDTPLYVLKGENGTFVYTTEEPVGNTDDYQKCYGKLVVTQDDDGNFHHTFTAWEDTEASKHLRPGEKVDFTFNIQVTDESTAEIPSGTEENYNDNTTTDGSFTVTLVGKADKVEVKNSTNIINEEGQPGNVENGEFVPYSPGASGSLAVTGTVYKQDFDGAGFTVSGVKGQVDADAFTGGKTVVEGDYGTLVLHSDGSYTYMLNYDKCQSLSEGKQPVENFTVQVSNSAGQSYADISITIYGVNDLPVVTVTPALSVQEGLPSVEGKPNSDGTATGKVDAQDVDESDTLSYGIMVDDTFVFAQPGAEGSSDTPATVYVVGERNEAGELTLSLSKTEPSDGSLVGTLTMNASGEYTFTVANSAMAQSLNGGKSESITVNIGANDGHDTITKPVTITIHGTNEAPEVSSSLQTSEDAMVEVTGGNQITFTPNDTTSDSGYTVTDADRGDTLTYTFEQGGRYFTSSDAVISINGKEYPVSLSIDPDGTITMTYNDDVKNAIDALGEGETATLTSQINLVVQDGFGGKTSSPLTLSVSGENDAVVITADQSTANIEIVDGAASSQEGSFTFTDVDANDTHTVALPETVQVTLPGENPQTAQVDTETGVVKLGEIELGKLEVSLEKDSANGATGEVSYTFDPSREYLTGLGTGEEVKLDLTFTVSDGNGSDETTSVSVTLTGRNDEVEITAGESTEFTIDAADKLAEGSFTFTDKDVTDEHSVSSSVQVTLPDGKTADATVENGVVTLDGTVLGTLEVTRNNDSTGGETGQVSYTFKPSSDYLTSLGKGESTQLDLVFTVSDGNGSEKTTSVSVTLTGSNDAVSISSDNFSTTPNEDGTYTGSLVFSDADVTDTHTVTFNGLYGTKNGTALSVNTATDSMPTDAVPVYNVDGVLIGTMQFAFGKDNGKQELTYTFTPVDPNSLPVGDHSVNFTVSVDDGNESTDSVDEPYTITITNENDEVNISSDDASLTPNNRVYEGSLVFSDKDVTDTHTVTFKGLYGNGGEGESLKPLSVSTADLSETSSSVPVYNAEGVLIGSMQFEFTKGENDTNTLSYTFNPDEKLTENLAVVVSVSDGHKTETAPTVNVTFNKPEEVELPDVSEGSGDGGEAEEEQARVEQENGLLTAAMVVSGLNGVLDASFDAPLFDAQTDAPDVPEGQDVFAVDSLVLPDAPDAPAFAVADASAEHAAPQMFSLHADPAIPEAAMHESAADTPDASPADDASSDAPDLISFLADNDPGAPEHGFLFGAPEGDVFSGSDGNDYMVGGEGSDAVMAGDGNDIVVYDGNDYLIDGGSGIDFIVSNDDSLSLNKLLTESGRDGHAGPIVNGVEVLIKGDDALSLTSMDQLSKDYGVTIGHDAQGNETLTLNADQWHANGDGSFDYVGQPNVDLTLETSLTPVSHDDAADAAVQQQVFILQNTQG